MYILIANKVSTNNFFSLNSVTAVADPGGGKRGVQMHPPLAASNVFLRT